MESLAYQVMEVEKRKAGSRGPASVVGNSAEAREIGSDPWGRSYLYKYIEIQGQQSLLLWSKGPDGLSQIEAPTQKMNGKTSIQSADDFGVLIPIER